MESKIIAVDFDGCLCENAYPCVGRPNYKAINALLAEKSAGAKIILWTCRVGTYLNEAVAEAKSWGIEFDAINENLKEMIDCFGSDCRKVFADEYWDDRSVCVKF